MNLGLGSGTIHFKITHEEIFLPSDLNENKGVRRDKTGGIIKVCIAFACCNNEKRRFLSHGEALYKKTLNN